MRKCGHFEKKIRIEKVEGSAVSVWFNSKIEGPSWRERTI